MIPALAQLSISSLVCMSLLSIWAATSSRHWFFRTGVFVAVLALLLLIPAYEPLVVFVLQGAVVAAGVQGARWWRRRKEGRCELPRQVRFSLATLLLVMVYVAIAAAVAAHLPVQGFYVWLSTMLIGVVAGWATLLGLWMVHGQMVRWWLRVAMGLVLALGISLLPVWDDWVFLSYTVSESPYNSWVLVVVGVSVFSSALLWLMSGVAVGKTGRFRSRLKRILASVVLLLSAIVLVIPPADVYYRLMTPLPIPETVLPNPNGWDDLVAAGNMVESSKELATINDYDIVPQPQLSTAVKAMAPAYKQLRIGLEKQVRCPVDYNDSEVFNMNIEVLSSLRSLARALAGRSRLATMEGRFEDAAESSVEGIRLGYAIRRGGLIVDSLVGSACSGIGRHALHNVHEDLSASHCLRLIAKLGQFEKQAEPMENFIRRDRVWTQHAYGWQGHLWQILDDVDSWDFTAAYNRERAAMRLLRLELAIHAWRKMHGSLPRSLGELVPQIIEEIPVDPFEPKGGLLQYRPTEENTDVGYVLYSVGLNGTDEGGVAPDEEDVGGFETGDMRLDIRYAPEPEAVEETEEELEDEGGSRNGDAAGSTGGRAWFANRSENQRCQGSLILFRGVLGCWDAPITPSR